MARGHDLLAPHDPYVGAPEREPTERSAPSSWRIERGLLLVVRSLAGLLMLSLVVLVIAGVLARQVGNQALTWSDESSRYIFVSLTFIAAAIAIARDEHPRITAVARLLSTSWCTRIERALVLAYLGAFFAASVMYSSSSTGESAATLPLPMTLITSIAAIGAGLMLVFVLFKIGHESQPLKEVAWTLSFAAVAAALGVALGHGSTSTSSCSWALSFS